MHTTDDSSRILRGALALIVLGAIFLTVQYLPLETWPHPVATDDYTNVGSSIADMSTHWKRPVSANLIFFFAHHAPASSYLFLAGLAVINAALVLWLLSVMFDVRIPVVATCAFGIAVFSHVSAFSHAVYLGLLTNLISHLFGMVTLLALWHGWQPGRRHWLWLALGAFALSAFAKEDFLLPPLLLVAFLALRPQAADTMPRRTRWLVAAVLLGIAVGSMAWQAHVRNPFVAGLFSPETSPAVYAIDLSPAGLASSFWRLLAEFALPVLAVAVVAWIAMFAKLPRYRLALLWYAAVIVTLVLPYAVIPRTIFPARAYAWLPWLVGIAVVGWASMQSTLASPRHRALASSAAIVAALLLACAHWPARTAPVHSYVQQVAMNRRMIGVLTAHREDLVRHPLVGLVGLGEWGPWCAQDALYVNGNLGFHAQRWVVFVPAPTRCYTQQQRDVVRKRGVNVAVADLSTLCRYGPMPVLAFDPDGAGRLMRADAACRPPR